MVAVQWHMGFYLAFQEVLSLDLHHFIYQLLALQVLILVRNHLQEAPYVLIQLTLFWLNGSIGLISNTFSFHWLFFFF
ncbi:MAG: hypothetical protein IPK55_11705 [Streptococcus sp.]|nr:hypothetical protein [Streptococcus sp.]